MLHKEDFCEHFCEMSDKEIVDDIRKSIASFMKQREEGEDFGAKMVHKAKLRIDAVHDVRSDAGKQGGRPRKETTADVHTREDWEFKSDSGDAGNLESATSANLYGDAAHREAADVSTTFSNPMRRVPQNEAPAHGFSGGRTAQGTMSRSPEAAAQSGKDYDQETDPVSTDEARQSQRRAGADSVRGTPLQSAPARQRAKNSRCPNSREEFHAFVADNNLHEGLAEEWYAIHEARGWVDENGNPIKNWRGALKNFCIKVEQKRRTA